MNARHETMTEEGVCPRCHERELHRDEVNVGVGIIHGPWGCPCGWSEYPEYDLEFGGGVQGNGSYLDPYGGLLPAANPVAKMLAKENPAMTADSSKATARPWVAEDDVVFADTAPVAICDTDAFFTEENNANAALIAGAVNRDHAFDAMKEALEQVEAEMRAGFGSSFGETREQVRRALRVASGEEQ